MKRVAAAATLAGAASAVLENPTQRVVKLLQQMSTELTTEAEKDQAMYGKLHCWCGTNKKEKEASVKEDEAKTDSLGAEINGAAAKKAKLEVGIKQTVKELRKNKVALEKAEELRKKENKEFTEQDTDLTGAIANLKNAITILSKHQAGLLQMTPELVQGVSTVLHAARQHAARVSGGKSLPTAGKPGALALMQGGSSAVFLQAATGNLANPPVMSEKTAGRLVASFAQKGPAHLQAYSSQSGQIFGILQSMMDDFTSKQGQAFEEEKAAVAAFKALKAAKQEEVAAQEEQLASHKETLANSGRDLAQAKEDLAATREARAGAQQFLQNLQTQCMDIDHQWEERGKERSAEQAAVADAIKILAEDDSRDLISRSTMFLQTRASAKSRRAMAASLLRAKSKSPAWEDLSFAWAAQHGIVRNPKADLATLAVSVQLDAFTKVKEAMDKLAGEIKAQIAADVEHNDYCRDELHTNSQETTGATHKAEDLSTDIEDLGEQITALQRELKQSEATIAATQKEVKKAGEDREEENHLFQTDIADQRATQVVVQKALDRLNEYYKAKKAEEAAVLLQTRARQGQTPPGKLQPYKTAGSSSSVLSMLEKVIEDSKAVETESVKDEAAAQEAYQRFVADSNATVETLQKKFVTDTESVAKRKQERVSTESDLKSTKTAVEGLQQFATDLHTECDFLQKNFELRQNAMKQEVEAIQEAKGILSGAQ